MDHKKRAKIENTVFFILMMLGFMLCGGFIGAFIATVEKQSGAPFNFLKTALSGALGLVILYLAYMIHLYLHEVGHVLFGLMTGYRFSSIRFGKLMIVKTDGKLKLKKYSLPGTGGQALMLPPELELRDYPVFWYNVGGLIMNLILCAIGGLGYALVPAEWMYLKIFCMSFVVTGATLFVTNALPFASMGTDGANIRILRKDPNARVVFRNILELAKNLSASVPMADMPESIFQYDKEMKMTNPLVTSQAVNRFSYLMVQKNFDEAFELGQYILDHAEAINQLHELDLRVELIYILAVHKADYEEAKKRFHAEWQRLKKIASLLVYQRSMYAYYTLAEPDEKKAAACRKTFEAIAKNYPYPEDAKAERELMEYADTKKAADDGQTPDEK